MLGKRPKLRVFSYSHKTKRHRCGHDWESELFVSALANCVGKTLKQLALRAKRGCVPYGIPLFARARVDFWILFKPVDGVEDILQHPLTSCIEDVSIGFEEEYIAYGL